MIGISALLQDAYANTKTANAATSEDLEKEASLRYFDALCAKENIDVERLDENQIGNLFKVAMQMKAAEEESAEKEKKEEGKKAPPPPFGKHEKGETPKAEAKEEEKVKEKEAAALQELEQKIASAVAEEQADKAGRRMADSFIDQMQKRAAAGEEGPAGDAARQVIEQMKVVSAGPRPSDTPNLDWLAGNKAIDMLKEAGYDEEQVVARVNAVYTMGLPESVKLAGVFDMESAVKMRAFEICELAGAPVDWSKV
jgi:hypothetical protein